MIVDWMIKKSLSFIEPGTLLSHPQQSVTEMYHGPAESSPYPFYVLTTSILILTSYKSVFNANVAAECISAPYSGVPVFESQTVYLAKVSVIFLSPSKQVL
jgi:hypothetical protein